MTLASGVRAKTDLPAILNAGCNASAARRSENLRHGPINRDRAGHRQRKAERS